MLFASVCLCVCLSVCLRSDKLGQRWLEWNGVRLQGKRGEWRGLEWNSIALSGRQGRNREELLAAGKEVKMDQSKLLWRVRAALGQGWELEQIGAMRTDWSGVSFIKTKFRMDMEWSLSFVWWCLIILTTPEPTQNAAVRPSRALLRFAGTSVLHIYFHPKQEKNNQTPILKSTSIFRSAKWGYDTS